MMEDVGTPDPEMGNEVVPTWEQAVEEFEAATPGEVVRTPRSIMVIYRYTNGKWHASSPSLSGFEARGDSLDETQRAVRADLSDYLDPAVRLDERVWHPWQVTTQAGPIFATGVPLAVTAGINGLIATTTQNLGTQGSVSISVATNVTAGFTVPHHPAWPQSRADNRMLVVMANTPTTVGQAA